MDDNEAQVTVSLYEPGLLDDVWELHFTGKLSGTVVPNWWQNVGQVFWPVT